MDNVVDPGMDVVDLTSVGLSDVHLVGGKAARLGELSRIEGIQVPAGFCVTTAVFRRAAGAALVPDDALAAIETALARFGDGTAFAVRSSATVEDSPTASFAGLHDSYLGIVGRDAVIDRVLRCWHSLSAARATAYRSRMGVDLRSVLMAVVVQQMVDATAAGVLFTADPLTGHRKVVSIDAVFGLGDALVSGHVAPDVVKVRDGQVIERATPTAGRSVAVLTDEQAIRLAGIGRRIEAHFGGPQDVEWCLVDDEVHIVQGRPITTLFPVPVLDDGAPHVYVSVGHQQMMTDPMKPLGLTLWQRLALVDMHEAAGRLFVDVAPLLMHPATRADRLELLGRSDPLIGDALQTVVERGDLLPVPEDDGPTPPHGPPAGAPPEPPPPLATDSAIVAGLIRQHEASVAELERDIAGRSGTALIDFVIDDVQELQRLLTDRTSHQAITAGMEATWWLNDHLAEWLGETDAADAVARSAPGNVTSEMGLALLDVADAVRPHPEVVAFLRGVGDDDTFLDDLPRFDGGREARTAILAYLDAYGMRCVGEIDITRPRWSEHPSALVPVLLADVDHFEPGEARRRFERGQERAAAKERDILGRLRTLPDGVDKADETQRMIGRVRTFIGYREYPKFGIVRRLAIWKRALMAEADRLVAAGTLAARDDVGFLRLDELREAVRTQHVDAALVERRKEEHTSNHALRTPRVLTSDGETLSGSYRRDDVPPGALVGLAVSAGTIEGRARVVVDMSAAELEPGDILVTTFTDPSWSPLFVAAAGLVTEVGGLVTHGAVIAREYGLPAVVGVDRATQLIRDGQKIRVHGTHGYVEILEDRGASHPSISTRP